MHVYSLITSELKELQSIKDFANFVMTKYNFMETDISDVFSVFIMFFILPVTVASVERSFSKLKLIKDYKRNSMGQLRLNDLSILAIESSEAKKMDLKNLISKFAAIKARKKQFL